jgi:hypothetical protein
MARRQFAAQLVGKTDQPPHSAWQKIPSSFFEILLKH